MWEARILHLVLRRAIARGGVVVQYPNGKQRKYGPEESRMTVIIHSNRAIRHSLRHPYLGFGECYTDGSISIDGPLNRLDDLLTKNAGMYEHTWLNRLIAWGQKNDSHLHRQQISKHYDLGNDFYRLWLDSSQTYTCAYFRSPDDTLEQAQANKRDHILRKLMVEPGNHVLDIGSGWGSLLLDAAKQGATGLGVTLSEEQHAASNLAAKQAGVDDKIRFELMDYLDVPKLNEKFDRVVSVGFFEHVGAKNLNDYFDVLDAVLKDDGYSVLHTIAQQRAEPTDAWIERYIFPGGYIPATQEVVPLLASHRYRIMNLENLRFHYAKTLDHWLANFRAAKDKVVDMNGEDFFRMWELYLGGASGAFRYGNLDLIQYAFYRAGNENVPMTHEYIYK